MKDSEIIEQFKAMGRERDGRVKIAEVWAHVKSGKLYCYVEQLPNNIDAFITVNAEVKNLSKNEFHPFTLRYKGANYLPPGVAYSILTPDGGLWGHVTGKDEEDVKKKVRDMFDGLLRSYNERDR